jgi:hypothetical protein
MTRKKKKPQKNKYLNTSDTMIKWKRAYDGYHFHGIWDTEEAKQGPFKKDIDKNKKV